MRSSHSKKSRGFTLIEVVVGLTLMATVVVASLLAFSAHQKQIRKARSKMAAIQITDNLLNRMSANRTGIPPSATGIIAEHPNWFWRTSVTAETSQSQIPLRIIQLQIFERQTGSELNLLASTSVVKVIEP
jgi:type II secretion system protein I